MLEICRCHHYGDHFPKYKSSQRSFQDVSGVVASAVILNKEFFPGRSDNVADPLNIIMIIFLPIEQLPGAAGPGRE